MRLDKFLANAGVGTRKEVKKYIQKGLVKVNNEVVKVIDYKVNEIDKVMFNNEYINFEEYYYYMLNKPKGVVSATKDREETVIDLIDSPCSDLFPVGRLDKDTEGLLLITNNGKVAHNMLSPRKHVFKTYYAHIKGYINEEHIEEFKKGIIINGDYKCKEAKLTILKSGEISEILVEISEGKFHQVKKMFKAIGCEVIYLKRITFGEIELDNNLPLGDYRKLNDVELKLLEPYM